MRCITTASLRAKATSAFFMPALLATLAAQLLSCEWHNKKLQQTEALGRLRVGFTTKLHARCHARGLPLGFMLTLGKAHDVRGYAPQFRMITDQIEAFLADRGYDADAIRDEIEAAGVEAVIRAKAGRRNPATHDRTK